MCEVIRCEAECHPYFWRSRQAVLITSNIDFSDILETPSYIVLSPWRIKPLNTVLDLVHLKKDSTDDFIFQHLISWKFKHPDYISVYTDGSRGGNSVAHATGLLFFHHTS